MTSKEKAASGVEQIKDAIVDYLREHPEGVQHARIVDDLELHSDYEGEQHNYLSWSVLGLLLAEKRVRYERRGRAKFYFVC